MDDGGGRKGGKHRGENLFFSTPVTHRPFYRIVEDAWLCVNVAEELCSLYGNVTGLCAH